MPYSNKRYNTFDTFLKNKFGGKIAKLGIDAGFTCPNRDGSKGTGGCIYCSQSRSGDFCKPGSITAQLNEQKKIMLNKWPVIGYIPYFQAGTGTYASPEILEPMWREAMQFENSVGLAIATRPDCITDETLELLKRINKETFLTVELGLQTIHDKTAELINRCHTYDEFLSSYGKLRNADIPICVHIINGLPGETHEMMLQTASVLAALKPDFVKIHMLHILADTPIADLYANGNFSLLSKDKYISIVADQIELFPWHTVFERLTGDGKSEDLIAPRWSRRKREVLNGIDMELKRRNSFQGRKANTE